MVRVSACESRLMMKIPMPREPEVGFMIHICLQGSSEAAASSH